MGLEKSKMKGNLKRVSWGNWKNGETKRLCKKRSFQWQLGVWESLGGGRKELKRRPTKGGGE